MMGSTFRTYTLKSKLKTGNFLNISLCRQKVLFKKREKNRNKNVHKSEEKNDSNNSIVQEEDNMYKKVPSFSINISISLLENIEWTRKC